MRVAAAQAPVLVEFYGVSAAGGGTVYWPNGDGKVGGIDARDIGEGAAATLVQRSKHDGKAYVLTGPEALSTAEAAATLAQALASRSPTSTCPRPPLGRPWNSKVSPRGWSKACPSSP